MFTVYLWVDKDSTELLGIFPDQYYALEFMCSFAHLHCISIDNLTLGRASVNMLIDMLKEKF